MKDLLNDNLVTVIKSKTAEYPYSAPFSPNEYYAEYLFDPETIAEDCNDVYKAVRDAFLYLGMDKENYGTKEWNPLKELVKKGDRVVIKPNLVSDKHREGGELFSIITHPSIIRAVCDYVLIALEGEGEIIIADAPQANTDFNNLLKETNLLEVVEFYSSRTNVKVEVRDLRQLIVSDYEDSTTRDYADRDPEGYSVINLAEKSRLNKLNGIERIYGADYNRSEVREHHREGKHEYCVANTILKADVIINLPKVKTHRKAGVTLSLKNMVGINGNKNFLPHFRIGVPEDGGDEYAELDKGQKKVMYSKRYLQDRLLSKNSKALEFIYGVFSRGYKILTKRKNKEEKKSIICAGNWYGNDTIWRTVLDLNYILLYAAKDGTLRRNQQRRYFTILDGVWAGEGEGPLVPKMRKFGYIIAGQNPICTDLVTIKLMGLDCCKIPLMEYLLNEESEEIGLSCVKENEICVSSNDKTCQSYMIIDKRESQFLSPEGWTNKLNS